MSRHLFVFPLILGTLWLPSLVFSGFNKKDATSPVPTPNQDITGYNFDFTTLSNNNYIWDLPKGFPEPNIPTDNPMTEAKVMLGRYLFYDPILSGNGTASCNSCHLQARAFSDGREKAVGILGDIHPRNSQHLVNIAYNSTLTWNNPGLTKLEQQILIPLFNETPVELGLTYEQDTLLEALSNHRFYAPFFAYAFPDSIEPVSVDHIVKSLAAFVRTMVSGESDYDRYVYGGDKEALSQSAKLGMTLFLSERLECHHCHGGFNFAQSTTHASIISAERPFHNTGLYNLVDKEGNAGNYPHPNTGVFEHTGNPNDMGKFRAPSLRNVALTAPYFHDGSTATLAEVIAIYEAGGRNITTGAHQGDGRQNPYKDSFVQGFSLNDEERQGLLDFLHALTDENFIKDARFSNPLFDESPFITKSP